MDPTTNLGHFLPPCLFRALTGVPCPTCGTTRGTLALLSGHPFVALAYNPGVFLAGTVLACYLACAFWREYRTGQGPAPVVRGPATRVRLAVLGATLLLANWAYVIWHERLLTAMGGG